MVTREEELVEENWESKGPFGIEARREEIRGGMERILREELEREMGHSFAGLGAIACHRIVKKQQEFEDSQGVVIKVDRELPESQHTVKGEHEHGYYEYGQEDMLEAGYVAVEPLIDPNPDLPGIVLKSLTE